jgi:hypothetical protein
MSHSLALPRSWEQREMSDALTPPPRVVRGEVVHAEQGRGATRARDLGGWSLAASAVAQRRRGAGSRAGWAPGTRRRRAWNVVE